MFESRSFVALWLGALRQPCLRFRRKPRDVCIRDDLYLALGGSWSRESDRSEVGVGRSELEQCGISSACGACNQQRLRGRQRGPYRSPRPPPPPAASAATGSPGRGPGLFGAHSTKRSRRVVWLSEKLIQKADERLRSRLHELQQRPCILRVLQGLLHNLRLERRNAQPRLQLHRQRIPNETTTARNQEARTQSGN